MSRKLPMKRWKNDDAFSKKELYFNLHSKKTDDEDISYEFTFLTADQAQNPKEGKLWYLVKNILKYSQAELVKEVIIKNGWVDDDLAMDNISLLHSKLTSDEIINYFEVSADSIDSVLDIFVRINANGKTYKSTIDIFPRTEICKKVSFLHQA